ncbi:MAG: hypothetical protein WBQ79_04325 [Acidobacteriaceae bacterium]
MSGSSHHLHMPHEMNWPLILGLSLFGLAMGIGTVFFISSKIEPYLWVTIFLISAFLIARHSLHRRFLHGLIVGVANSIWITATHILFFARYMGGHAREEAMLKSVPLFSWPRLMMVVTGPVVGIMSGIIIGTLAIVCGLMVRQSGSKAPEAAL